MGELGALFATAALVAGAVAVTKAARKRWKRLKDAIERREDTGVIDLAVDRDSGVWRDDPLAGQGAARNAR